MKTKELLQSIGYPADGNFGSSASELDSGILQLAMENKIASLYVDRCNLSKDIGSDELELVEKWRAHPDCRDRTIERFYNNVGDPDQFIIVKSRYGFPADCSDIDVLVDSTQSVDEIVSSLSDEDYEVLGIAPTASTIRDKKTDQLVDIQTDFGLHNIIYFDDSIVTNNQILPTEFSNDISAVHRGTDIALHINHSITELMFTLKEYYTTVYFLETCTEKEYQKMVEAIQENRTGYGAGVFFGLIIEISKKVFDRTPARADQLSADFILKLTEFDRLHQNRYKMPHKYGLDTLLRYSTSRLRQPVFIKSMLNQILHMLDPRNAYYFVSKFYDRATRDHYMR